MNQIDKKHAFLLIGLAVLLTLACSVLRNVPGSDQADCENKGGIWKSESRPDGSTEEWCQEVVFNPEHDCNNSTDVRIYQNVVKKETNEFNTRLCTFSVTFSLDNPAAETWIMALVHKADMYAGTESYEWQTLMLAEADHPSTYEFSGYFDIYNDPEEDKVGPALLDIERYTAIPNTPDCADLRFDEDYLEAASVVIEPTCPE